MWPCSTNRDESDYRHTLEIIEQQAARLSRIVEDMFTLARADAGTYPVRRTAMYLDEVVDDVVRAARVLASTKDVSIELGVPSAAFTGDEDLIRRLVVNLMDNAVRHSPSGQRRARRAPEVPAGTISAYRGPGIPLEIQPHIFERFYRGDASRARGGHSDAGAGLGLALVAGLRSSTMEMSR